MPDHERALNDARAAIASACLGVLPDATLGDIQLRDHQRLTVARAQRLLANYGGCLIADNVGRGKTFVALALAKKFERRLFVVPSALRSAWTRSMERTAVEGEIISHDQLSRGHVLAKDFDVIVVDESHHFRTSTINRYHALAALAANSRLILLSATPLQNRTKDLAAQIALFLGSAAFTLSGNRLVEFVVRTEGDAGLPSNTTPRWLEVPHVDEGVLRVLAELPDSVRPRDAGDEGALRTIALVRAWASSRAALRATLRRRSRISIALEQGLTEGVLPSVVETRSWLSVDDAVQLGLVSLLVVDERRGDSDKLLTALARERESLDQLFALLRTTPDPDVARVQAMRLLRERSAGKRILAFSEFSTTVAAYFSSLKNEPGVGLLTAKEARIASGKISREELLARFAPRAQNGAHLREHEHVTLLLATDLLSEGLDLQDASIVVHLDLPWNPARLLQRLGRVRRPGGSAKVESYVMSPPASASALLRLETRLHAKAELAFAVAGGANEAMPPLTEHRLTELLEKTEALALNACERGVVMNRVREWHVDSQTTCNTVHMAATCHDSCGYLACLRDGTLVASHPTCEGKYAVSSAMDAAFGSPVPYDAELCEASFTSLDLWRAREHTRRLLGMRSLTGSSAREAINMLQRIASTIRRSDRAVLLPLLSKLCEQFHAPMPLGRENTARESVSSLPFPPSPDSIRVLIQTTASTSRINVDVPSLASMILFCGCKNGKHDGAVQLEDPVALYW